MHCSKCGKEVSSEERFCLQCGSEERQQASHKYGSGWYYLTGGEINRIRGPLSESSMRKMFIDETLNGNTNIRFGVDALWTIASDVPIFENVVKAPKTSIKISTEQISFYIVIAMLVFIMSAVIYTKTQSPRNLLESGNLAGYPIAQKGLAREVLTREAIITLTNNARALNGLPLLKENQLLNSIAQSRAQDMLDKQYFAHVSPTGQQASDIAQDVGYHYKIIAENIGSGNFYTNQKIVDGWMQSPGHRMNILSAEVEDIGAAVLKGKMKGVETYIAVQIFGLQSLPVSQNVCVAPSKSLHDDIDLKKAEIESLSDQLNRLKNELDAEKESIDTDQRYTYSDAQKIQKLNVRINTFNEKSRWYKRVAADAKAKSAVAESMVNEYNRMLQTYNDCQASH